jgi:hypothetical protein
MRNIIHAIERVERAMTRNLESRTRPPLKYPRRRTYVWRAPDARPTVVEPVVQDVVERAALVPLERRSARPRHVNKRRTKW